ncbi:hypothetical protein PSEUDO8BK_10599 [Pseudomonas sp. 8BK]|nr:hypothetical protein PSEUDO8BK_10599 [Pseudomonas sp. 8BK]
MPPRHALEFCQEIKCEYISFDTKCHLGEYSNVSEIGYVASRHGNCCCSKWCEFFMLANLYK